MVRGELYPALLDFGFCGSAVKEQRMKRIWVGKLRWHARFRECLRSLKSAVMALRGWESGWLGEED